MYVGRLAIIMHLSQKAGDHHPCMSETWRTSLMHVGRLAIITHVCLKAGDQHPWLSEDRRSALINDLAAVNGAAIASE